MCISKQVLCHKVRTPIKKVKYTIKTFSYNRSEKCAKSFICQVTVVRCKQIIVTRVQATDCERATGCRQMQTVVTLCDTKKRQQERNANPFAVSVCCSKQTCVFDKPLSNNIIGTAGCFFDPRALHNTTVSSEI